VLDNNYFSINFPQKYISCLIFYESLASYKKLYDKYKKSEQNDTDVNAYIDCSQYNSFKRRDTLKSFNTVKTVNNYVDFYNSENTNSNRKELDFENSRQSSVNSNFKNYYVPKCIILVSVYPFFIEFAKILKSIYKFSLSPKLKKPIEKIIENLVIEVPVPPRGFYSVEYQLFNEKYLLTQTPMNRLPFLSIEFEKIFINFKIEQILEIYKHFLLETRIIFFSADLSNLTPIIQGFLSLIYPFKYPFQFVTILPEENFNFLESVAPYIIGINEKYSHNFFTANSVDIENMTILIVDIDNRRLELTSPNLNQIAQIPLRNKFMSEEFPDLPKHYKAKLTNRIADYIKKIKEDSRKEHRDNFSINIRNLFFQFIVNILQNYSKYLNIDYYTHNEISSPSISNLFKAEAFINSADYCDRPFFRKLINETQMFVEFILKRMIPKDSREKLEILFFDENLMEKNSRRIFAKKVATPFIQSTLYDIKHTYSVQKHRGFTEDEIDYFKVYNNRKEALKHWQDISVFKGEIFISYPVFPCLMTNIFFKNSVKMYYLPPNLSEELESINVDIVSRSHLGSVSLQHCEMENYIRLCWIQLWAMTFWFHDEEEKRYRFQQLLNVLDNVINHEMEIFNLLFESLTKGGEDYMILKLYERLVFYRLNPSYSICTTVMKLIDKKQLLNSTGVSSIIKYVERYDFNKKYDTNKFRKRSFKSKYDLNIFGSEVQFYTWDTCIECQTEINLERIGRDFANMRRDILWATCSQCGTGLLPKISVRFGKELNHFGKLKFNTSSYEGFVLYSPFHLKYNYNNGLLKEFGLNLDVDSFKFRFNAIFWDSIWYFKIKNLEFDFMLPYEMEYSTDEINTHIANSFKINLISNYDMEKLNSKNSVVIKENYFVTETESEITKAPLNIQIDNFIKQNIQSITLSPSLNRKVTLEISEKGFSNYGDYTPERTIEINLTAERKSLRYPISTESNILERPFFNEIVQIEDSILFEQSFLSTEIENTKTEKKSLQMVGLNIIEEEACENIYTHNHNKGSLDMVENETHLKSNYSSNSNNENLKEENRINYNKTQM